MNGSATAFTANWNLVALVVIVPALVGGWYAVRGGCWRWPPSASASPATTPSIAETPLMDEFLDKDAKE